MPRCKEERMLKSDIKRQNDPDLSRRYDYLIQRYIQNDVSVPVISDDGEIAVLPGLCDVHVHFREPGFSYKETILTGTEAAARGGYTAVCTMPNLSPVPDCAENLGIQAEIIKKDATIAVYPYGSITKSEKGEKLSDMEEIAPFVCAFSDDGKGVRNADVMREAMIEAKRMNKVIAAHCEDETLLFGGYIHDGAYAKAHNHKGISSASEFAAVARDVALAGETGAKFHVCHVSTKESVEEIRRAKRQGIDVTCETAPHYLVLTENDLKEDGRFKMNPPVRSESDRKALIDGIKDGTVDMIATDHAPHSAEEKSKGLKGSAFGITGLETAFPVLYTKLVKTGEISLETLIKLMCVNPRERFGLPKSRDDFAIFDLKTPFRINSREFLSKGKSTPFDGEEVYGKCILTVCGGKVVWQDSMIENL